MVFKYRDQEGVYREKSTGKRKQAEARDFKHSFLEDLKQDRLPTDEAKWKLGHALTSWIEYRAATRPKSTVDAERTAARHIREILGGERSLNSIRAHDLRRFQMKRLETVGPKTVNNEMLVLTAVLKNAKLWASFEDVYEPLTVLKRGPGRALTVEDAARLVESAKTNDKWFVALCATVMAYATGCRSGEIKTLQLRDLVLDAEKPYIRIRAENCKTRREREPVLNELARWSVERLLQRAKILGSRDPEHYLLPADLSKHTKKSDPLHGGVGFDPNRHQSSWQSAWESLKKAAGVASLRFHDLRAYPYHSRHRGGVPIEIVMAQVGHLSADMTRHYTHLNSEAKYEAAAALQAKATPIMDVLRREKS